MEHLFCVVVVVDGEEGWGRLEGKGVERGRLTQTTGEYQIIVAVVLRVADHSCCFEVVVLVVEEGLGSFFRGGEWRDGGRRIQQQYAILTLALDIGGVQTSYKFLGQCGLTLFS